jgi:hypothetical protein
MAVSFDEFRTRIIEDGIAACKKDYKNDQSKRDGSIAGFQSCSNKTPEQIAQLLAEAKNRTTKAFAEAQNGVISSDEYWYIRCFEAEVEWVANCVSIVLINQGLPPIIPPTCRGAIKAAEIIGAE